MPSLCVIMIVIGLAHQLSSEINVLCSYPLRSMCLLCLYQINRESVRAYMQSQDEPIPKCLISLDWMDVTSHPEQLVYNVTLQGAKEPQVNITFSPGIIIITCIMILDTSLEEQRVAHVLIRGRNYYEFRECMRVCCMFCEVLIRHYMHDGFGHIIRGKCMSHLCI